MLKVNPFVSFASNLEKLLITVSTTKYRRIGVRFAFQCFRNNSEKPELKLPSNKSRNLYFDVSKPSKSIHKLLSKDYSSFQRYVLVYL
jgi:hypothetical protein